MLKIEFLQFMFGENETCKFVRLISYTFMIDVSSIL